MNQRIQDILARVCVRSYKPQQIGDEELNAVIECGLNAATARNLQPWHLTVIQDKEVIDRIVALVREGLVETGAEVPPEGYHNFYHAPTVIIVSGEDASRWADVDCGNLTQNMMLAADAVGLGSCYIGSFLAGLNTPKKDELLKLMQVPEGFTPRMGLCLGYQEGPRPERKPREYKVTFIK